jgi:hypothetical protein
MDQTVVHRVIVLPAKTSLRVEAPDAGRKSVSGILDEIVGSRFHERPRRGIVNRCHEEPDARRREKIGEELL